MMLIGSPPNLGDYSRNELVYVWFHSFDSNGASVTISDFAVTDIEIYRSGITTQRSSDNGITLLDTDGIDFDGLTGIHGFKIDLSDNSDAGFYAAGVNYVVVVSSITVDGQTVSFIAGTFSILREGGELAYLNSIIDKTTTPYGTLRINQALVGGISSSTAAVGINHNSGGGIKVTSSGIGLSIASSAEKGVSISAASGPGTLIVGGALGYGHGVELSRGSTSGDDLKFTNDDVTIPTVGEVTGDIGGDITGSVLGDVDITSISGDSDAANNLRDAFTDTGGVTINADLNGTVRIENGAIKAVTFDQITAFPKGDDPESMVIE